ncbi:Carboxylesterase family-domain-containing protein [Mycena rebaudengoi]|nr:Carboxylesterase family-domain-containing protein [Mycena rebaudengoi]
MQPQNWLTRIYLAAAVLVTVEAQTSGPIIDLGYAQYQGAVNPATNIANFKGIRYAAAPIGDLRFRAPQPPANVAGIQQATAPPNQCFQSGRGMSATNPFRARAAQIISTEDCLFLKEDIGNPTQRHTCQKSENPTHLRNPARRSANPTHFAAWDTVFSKTDTFFNNFRTPDTPTQLSWLGIGWHYC